MVWCLVLVATRASRGSGVVWRVSLWVGLVLRLVCEVLVCRSRVCPPAPPGVFEPIQVLAGFRDGMRTYGSYDYCLGLWVAGSLERVHACVWYCVPYVLYSSVSRVRAGVVAY